MSGKVERVLEGRSRDLGGFTVRRVLPSPQRQTVGPFIFLDQMGPVEFPAGRGIDVRPHPHIGLATVTYLFEGEILHRDSLGYVQAIRPGAVNWMTAGRGIVHSERSTPEARRAPQRLHGIQTWVALPRKDEEREPCFRHHPAESLPQLERGGATLRLIAGSAFGATSPVEVFSEMFYVDAKMPDASHFVLGDGLGERAVYVASGELEVGGDSYRTGQLLLLSDTGDVKLSARTDTRAMLLGGAPPDGERHIWWNLVSSSLARIEAAKAQWQADQFPPVPGEHERIPLPES